MRKRNALKSFYSKIKWGSRCFTNRVCLPTRVMTITHKNYKSWEKPAREPFRQGIIRFTESPARFTESQHGHHRCLGHAYMASSHFDWKTLFSPFEVVCINKQGQLNFSRYMLDHLTETSSYHKTCVTVARLFSESVIRGHCLCRRPKLCCARLGFSPELRELDISCEAYWKERVWV